MITRAVLTGMEKGSRRLARSFSLRASTVRPTLRDRKSTRLNSSHSQISYAVFCLKKKKKVANIDTFRKHTSHDWAYSLNERRDDTAPIPAHHAVAVLERLGHLVELLNRSTLLRHD